MTPCIRPVDDGTVELYTRGITMVPPVVGPLLTLESGSQHVAHLRHENVNIRPSRINSAMNGLFASPRIALNDTRTHLGRAAHRTGMVGRQLLMADGWRLK